MANIVRDLPKFTTVTSSGGAAFSNIISQLDDAASITIFLTSSAVAGTSGAIVQVSGWDPALKNPPQTNMTSSQWVTAGSVTSSLTAIVLSNISFRSMQLSFTGTSSFPGEVLAWVSKQISV